MVVVRCMEDDRRLVSDLVPCGVSSGLDALSIAAVSLASSNASYKAKSINEVFGSYPVALEGVV